MKVGSDASATSVTTLKTLVSGNPLSSTSGTSKTYFKNGGKNVSSLLEKFFSG